METTDKKWWWISIGAIVLVVIIVFGIFLRRRAQAPLIPVVETPSSDTSVLRSNGNFSDVDLSTQMSLVKTVELTYDEALKKYGDNRIQFDTNCQAHRSALTWKNNTSVMLDNRSPETRLFHLGTIGDVTITAWGFKVVNFVSDVLPLTVMIDCGTVQNVATVLIQQ